MSRFTRALDRLSRRIMDNLSPFNLSGGAAGHTPVLAMPPAFSGLDRVLGLPESPRHNDSGCIDAMASSTRYLRGRKQKNPRRNMGAHAGSGGQGGQASYGGQGGGKRSTDTRLRDKVLTGSRVKASHATGTAYREMRDETTIPLLDQAVAKQAIESSTQGSATRTDAEILELALNHLCLRDHRSPMFDELYGADDTIPLPRNGCSCDECFYGRDAMALVILQQLSQGK